MEALLIERDDAMDTGPYVDSDADTLPLDPGSESERLMQSDDDVVTGPHIVSDAETEPLTSESEEEVEYDEEYDELEEEDIDEEEEDYEDYEMDNEDYEEDYEGDDEDDELIDEESDYVLVHGQDNCTKCPSCKKALNLKSNASINVADFSYIVTCSRCLRSITIRNMISERQKSLLRNS